MSYWRLFYHVVFATYERLPQLREEIAGQVYAAISEKASRLGALVYAIGGTEDHVHVAVSVPPALSIAQFVGQIKGNSSHFVNHVLCPDFQFAWQQEYGVVSFGEKQLNTVVRYIRGQREHHQAGTTISRLEVDRG